MRVSVRGDVDGRVERLCHNYAAELDLSDDVVVRVSLVKRIRGVGGADRIDTRRFGPTVGVTRKRGDVYHIGIRLDTDIEATLMHELVHVAQFVSGRLAYVPVVKMHAIWEGIDHGPLSKIDYAVAPWEIEAREKEKT